MKNTVFLIGGLLISFSLGFLCESSIKKQPEKTTAINQFEMNGKLKRVTGVGGIFFKCKDPNKIKEWYKIHLGFNTDQYGARFEWRVAGDSSKKESLQWSPFAETESYFAPSAKDFMINYRVENIADLVTQLKKEGVTIVDSIETYDYGKFVHIMDAEENKIELFEPNYNYGKKDKANSK